MKKLTTEQEVAPETEQEVAPDFKRHKVADGVSLTTMRGILANGDFILAEHLSGGLNTLNLLIEKDLVVVA